MAPPLATLLASRAAQRLGAETEILDDHGYLFEVRRGPVRRVLLGGRSPLNDAVAARLAEDKHYTTLLLGRAGIPVPETARCLSPRHPSLVTYRDQAGAAPGHALADRLGFPLVVKPNRLSHGRGVRAVADGEALDGAIEAVWELDAIALVQERIEGRDVRLDFLDGAYLAGYERAPVVLEGDGARSARALLEAADPRFAEDRERLEPAFRAALRRQDLAPDSILAPGRRVSLESTVLNLNGLAVGQAWSTCPPALRELAGRVAEAMHLRHLGLDLRLGPDGAVRAVLEVNASPLVGQLHRMGHEEMALAATARVLAAVLEEPAA